MPPTLLMAAVVTILIVCAGRAVGPGPWNSIAVTALGLAALAYAVVKLVPAWRSALERRAAGRRIRRALAPERRYRMLVDQLAVADTIAIRAALGEQCRQLGLFEEARRHDDAMLARPDDGDTAFMLGRAQAEFGLGRHADAIAKPDAPRRCWPHDGACDGHFLHATALEEGGRLEEALEEYVALARYDTGAEPRVRQAFLRRKLGRVRDAGVSSTHLLATFARAPEFVRKRQAAWLAVAEKALRG